MVVVVVYVVVYFCCGSYFVGFFVFFRLFNFQFKKGILTKIKI